MDLLNTDAIEKQGIKGRNADATHKLYQNMVKWGWIDGLGRSRDWMYWNRQRSS